MNNLEKWIDRILLNKWFYIIVTIVFITIFAFVFKWQHICYIFNNKYIVDNELLGTYGDFVGGVLGTIFALISVLIMIRTFNQQRNVTIKNQEQLENQRFNELFFELLHLYQTEVSELCGCIENSRGNDISVIKYNNKDFYDFEKHLLQKAFKPTNSYDNNRSQALNLYTLFYVKNRTKVAACFRTLYRIYDLIDTSNLQEEIKKEYLKIIRAQLTESELFFIRYNAMSYYGKNFINYLNKYNVLKHLPTFELLEFKDWWKDINMLERLGINVLFQLCRKEVTSLLTHYKNGKKILLSKQNSKYHFTLIMKSTYELEIEIKIDQTKLNDIMEFKGFDSYSDKKIQALLDCFLKETFLYSNFEKFNIKENLQFYSEPILVKDSLTIINSGVKNIKHQKLKLR